MTASCTDIHGVAMNDAFDASTRVAIVESCPAQTLSRLVALGLAEFNLSAMASAGDLYRSLLTQTFDIVVICSCLPDENVSTMVRHLRAHSSTLCIVIFSDLVEVESGILAPENVIFFESTPADFEKLKSRLLQLRRALHEVSFGGDTWEVALARGSWILDAQTLCLTAPNGALIPLSRAESAVLGVLIRAYGELVSREQLLELLNQDAQTSLAHRPDPIIHSLRRKVLRRSGQPLPLLTVRKAGYVFSMDRMPE